MIHLSWIRVPSVAAVALLGMALVGACGEDEGDSDEDPERVLDRTFSERNEVESGVLDASFELTLATRDSEESQRVSVSGPFAGEGEGRAPRFDLAVRADLGGGEEHDLDLIATATAGFVGFEGEGYTVDPEVFERFRRGAPLAGLEPERWFTDPSNEGSEDVAGTETVRIAATANAERLLPGLERAARRIGLRPTDIEAPQESFEEATIEALIGADDRVLRRLELNLEWEGEGEGGEPFDASLEFSLGFDEVNQEQEIDAPEDARPVSELVGELPPELSGLGEFLSGGSRAGGSARRSTGPPATVGIERGRRDSSAPPPRRCPDRALAALPLRERSPERAERAVLRREDPSEEPEARAVPARKAGARGANARFLCGQGIARRTIVVFVHRAAFDRGPNRSASLGQGVFFVSRFPDGHRTWHSPHP